MLTARSIRPHGPVADSPAHRPDTRTRTPAGPGARSALPRGLGNAYLQRAGLPTGGRPVPGAALAFMEPGLGTVWRPATPEMAEIEALLGYGPFDWAITDEDAVRALSLVKALSRFQQAAFFARTSLARRLRENLPKSRVAEWDALAAGVTELRAPAATEEAIETLLGYGLFDWAVTPKEAVEVLELLKKLSTRRMATMLTALDYERLVTALPSARRPELTELRERALGAGGARQSEEEEHPGAFLRSLTFRSDHGVLKDNDVDWTSSGRPYGEPEWTVDKGRVTSRPISQTRDTRLTVELGMDVHPVNAPPAPVRLTGTSADPAFSFDYTGSLRGGKNQSLTLTSAVALPDTVTALENRRIAWLLEWRGWRHEVARSRHTVFVTAGTPRAPDEVTHKRMRTAVALVGEVARTTGLDPHRLVAGLMRHWGRYNVHVVYDNPWELADNIALGAQCLDITGFVRALLSTVGVPGTAESVVVWAEPGNPRLARVDKEPHHGLGTVGPHPGHFTWRAVLMDAHGCPNQYEAALRFEHGGVQRFYPGGVRPGRVFATAEDVLFLFQCLAWASPAGERIFIERIETTYPHGSCRLGPTRCD
ncbi:hypothetical protein ABZ547_33485 [Streptomyces sparsogenes]|uniref:hypothetical protein n=1 Tax=Streptomyces sparsogenes TaxID=67365 RepID=UPI0033FF2903